MAILKLTATFALRLLNKQRRALRKLAKMANMREGEYIRSLIDREAKKAGIY